VHFKLITAAESARFDEFMSAAPHGHIFQSYAWGEVKRPTWEPLRAIAEEDGAIVAAASILKRKIPMLGRSFFYLPRGPVLRDWEDTRVFTLFVDYLKQLAAEHRAIFVKMDPCIPSEATVKSLMDRNGFRSVGEEHVFGGLQPRYTYCLDISGDLEEIMSRFPKKIRYKIRYGPKKGLAFEHPGEEGLDSFIEVMKETGSRRDFVIRNPAYYEKVYRILSRQGAIDLVLGRYAGEVITAGMTIAFGDKAWAIYGGQKNDHRNLYAYHAMVWERIKWAKSKGARWFDFFGVPGHVSEDHPLYGIYYFKKSFGGQFHAFIGEKDLVLSPFHYFLWNRLFDTGRKAMLQAVRLRRNSRDWFQHHDKAFGGSR